MDIALDGILTILDGHCDDVKALGALDWELFQLCVGEGDGVGLGSVLIQTPADPDSIIPQMFSPDRVAKLKHDHFYGGLPKWLKAMVAYLKAGANEKTYSNYLQAAREAEKEEAMEPSHSQTADKPSKPKATRFFPL